MQEDEDSVVTLAFFPSEIEATIVAGELERAGIQAQPAGTLTAEFRAEAPGRVKVLVHARDLERAKELLEDYLKSREEIDWSQVDLGESEDADEG